MKSFGVGTFILSVIVFLTGVGIIIFGLNASTGMPTIPPPPGSLTDPTARCCDLRPEVSTRFWRIKTLQKFAAVHASIHNHFNQERHLISRETFKQNRAAALAELRTPVQ